MAAEGEFIWDADNVPFGDATIDLTFEIGPEDGYSVASFSSDPYPSRYAVQIGTPINAPEDSLRWSFYPTPQPDPTAVMGTPGRGFAAAEGNTQVVYALLEDMQVVDAVQRVIIKQGDTELVASTSRTTTLGVLTYTSIQGESGVEIRRNAGVSESVPLLIFGLQLNGRGPGTVLVTSDDEGAIAIQAALFIQEPVTRCPTPVTRVRAHLLLPSTINVTWVPSVVPVDSYAVLIRSSRGVYGVDSIDASATEADVPIPQEVLCTQLSVVVRSVRAGCELVDAFAPPCCVRARKGCV